MFASTSPRIESCVRKKKSTPRLAEWCRRLLHSVRFNTSWLAISFSHSQPLKVDRVLCSLKKFQSNGQMPPLKIMYSCASSRGGIKCLISFAPCREFGSHQQQPGLQLCIQQQLSGCRHPSAFYSYDHRRLRSVPLQTQVSLARPTSFPALP